MSRILINKATNEIIIHHLRMAESAVDRMRGLLGQASLPDGSGLMIRPCRSIHMWFMRFPIDAAFLDKELRVLRIVRRLRPWQLAWAPRRTRSVLETNAGALDHVNPGDQLLLR